MKVVPKGLIRKLIRSMGRKEEQAGGHQRMCFHEPYWGQLGCKPAEDRVGLQQDRSTWLLKGLDSCGPWLRAVPRAMNTFGQLCTDSPEQILGQRLIGACSLNLWLACSSYPRQSWRLGGVLRRNLHWGPSVLGRPASQKHVVWGRKQWQGPPGLLHSIALLA